METKKKCLPSKPIILRMIIHMYTTIYFAPNRLTESVFGRQIAKLDMKEFEPSSIWQMR